MSGDAALGWFDSHYGLIPARLSGGECYAGHVTWIFLHAGPLHLAGNMNRRSIPG
ncbi:hypothetical protein SAMN04488003_108161 [Loktanella fryxellensis]|uniref:Uncharacterized protein n=1 Tax=Loktanella fryxellensis TaxID=245187 RepID=A0A1H8DI57_9RHOB|nr:hypothetical protein [Loktanella fryxellensis]SEN07022.1 hypothetical protein SAMN04488003_108161 [Loktanella fryxellensis]